MTDYYLDIAKILNGVTSELTALNNVVRRITAKLANDIDIAHGLLQDLATEDCYEGDLTPDTVANTLRLVEPADNKLGGNS